MQMFATQDLNRSNLLQNVVTVPGRTPFDSYVSPGLPRAAALDPDLKLLIGWCLAQKDIDRVPLDVLLDTCERAVATRTEAYYQANPIPGSDETDDRLRAFLRDLIFDPIIPDEEADVL